MSRSRDAGVAAVDEHLATVVSDAVTDVARLSDGDRGAAYGRLLLALVEQAREDGVDAEQALREAARDYRARVRATEGLTD
jgi:hypothetical protein